MSTETTRGGHLLAALRLDRITADKRVSDIATAARGRSMTDDEQHDFDMATREVAALDKEIAAAEAAGPTIPPAASGPAAGAATVGRAEAAEIVKLCVDGGVPTMASGMLAEGIGVEDAKIRIAAVGEAASLVTGFRRIDASIPEDFAATMLAQGTSVDQIRAVLFDRVAAAQKDTAIISVAPARGDAARGTLKPVDLVADMKRRHGISA